MWITLPSRADLLLENLDGALKGVVAFQLFFDLVDPVDNGGMILVAKLFANILERIVGHMAAKVHGDLPRVSDIPAAFGAADILGRNIKMLRHDVDNAIHGDGL